MAALTDTPCSDLERRLRELQALAYQLRKDCAELCDGLPPSREVSIARTHLETGLLWIGDALQRAGVPV